MTINNFRKNLPFPASSVFGCFTGIILNKEKEKQGILPVLYPTSAALWPRQKHLRDSCALECLPQKFLSLSPELRMGQGQQHHSGRILHALTWTCIHLSPSPGFSPSGSLQPSCPHMVPIGCAKEQQDSYPLGFPEASSQVLAQGGNQTSWSFLLASTVFL